MSSTSTLKEQSAVFPATSVARNVTVETPTGKLDPLAWLGGTKATVAPGQLSDGVGVVNETLAAQVPLGAFTVKSAGHATVGF